MGNVALEKIKKATAKNQKENGFATAHAERNHSA